jgi:hypothetical protein
LRSGEVREEDEKKRLRERKLSSGRGREEEWEE